MRRFLEEKDLVGINSRDFKVALILPQLTGEKLGKCITYYKNIYKGISSQGVSNFDPIGQVVNKRIGYDGYTFLLVRDYEEQDELLTYFPEFGASFNRLDESGDLEMLKVMPNGGIIDANLIPLCRIKKISEADKIKLQEIFRNNMNGVENFGFTLVDDDYNGGVQVYYTKYRPAPVLNKSERKSLREYRFARTMRLFYTETHSVFGDKMYLNDNVEFCDELGGPVPKDAIFVSRRREKLNIIKEKYSSSESFVPSDFDKVECPEGYRVLAIKSLNDNCNISNISPILSKCFSHCHNIDCSTKVKPVMVDDREVVAIFCKTNSYKYMNNRVSTIHAHLMQNTFTRNDRSMFYHCDALGQVLPISYSHVCKVDACSVNSQKKLLNALTSKIGTGYNIELKMDECGDYNCFAVVNEEAPYKALRAGDLDKGKHDAIKEAKKIFSDGCFTELNNDGTPISQDKATQQYR